MATTVLYRLIRNAGILKSEPITWRAKKKATSTKRLTAGRKYTDSCAVTSPPK